MTTIERILCPVDFSDASRPALVHALALGRWYGAALTVLHVFNELPIVEATVASAGIGLYTPATPVDVASIESRLREFVAAAGGNAAVDVLASPAVGVRDEILSQASARRADLIVLGSRGLAGLTRLALGSTAENVLRHSTVPVLIVPPHAPAQPHAGVPFKRIVCAVDFEAESSVALHYAFDIAQQSDAALALVHVLSAPAARVEGGAAPDFDREEAHRTRIQEARSRIEALIPETARTY